MNARLPPGDPIPAGGPLPDGVLPRRPFGVYVHVPFCASRCGYCDFNTYTSPRLRPGYVEAALAEIAAMPAVPADTVFFGGGTPTLLEPEELAALLAAIPMAAGAEVTVEANPESVDERSLAALRAAGFTRVSLGMQSAASHVLAVLEREHSAGRAVAAAREARSAGFEHIGLDLIYGTPGETDDDWRRSLEAAGSAEPDHVSAYALTLEPGTRMHALVRRGELREPDEDELRRRYELAEELLPAAGLSWYELCNWAASDAARCRHNLGYWRSGDWWGIGPGAHSHVGGVRWWNVLHPTAWAARVAATGSGAAAREVLDGEARALEATMLEIRLRDGIRLEQVDPGTAGDLAARGLLDGAALARGRCALTLEGRLLADLVIRELARKPVPTR